jgi:hypothetical protein
MVSKYYVWRSFVILSWGFCKTKLWFSFFFFLITRIINHNQCLWLMHNTSGLRPWLRLEFHGSLQWRMVYHKLKTTKYKVGCDNTFKKRSYDQRDQFFLWSKIREEWVEVQWTPKCKEGATYIWRFVSVKQWQIEGAKQPNQLRVFKSNCC